MTLKADLERFPQAASNWEHVSSVIQEAHDLISGTVGEGWRFGLLAEGSIDKAYDHLATSMTGALTGGVHATTVMATTLHHVGTLFGLTDQEQATLLKKHRIDLEEDV